METKNGKPVGLQMFTIVMTSYVNGIVYEIQSEPKIAWFDGTEDLSFSSGES